MPDRFDLDPISQILGTQGAQINSLVAAFAELRADVITNRSEANRHRDRELQMWQQVEAELRNVKHENRGFEQNIISADYKIGSLEKRLSQLENSLQDISEKLRDHAIKLRLITGTAAAAGGVAAIIIEALARSILDKWF